MNAFLLVVPVFLIRYVYVAFKSKKKLQLLNYFPASRGTEKYGKMVYIAVNTFLLIAPLFMRIEADRKTVFPGGILYAIGLTVYALSIHQFISGNGLIRNGMYAVCRNPQALSFILMYSGIAVLTKSWLYFSLTVLLIWAFNEMAKSEERYCRQEFAEAYYAYMRFTRRFF